MKFEYLVEAHQQPQEPAVGIYKPMTMEKELSGHLNNRGEEGWELVEIIPRNIWFTLVFKRQRA